MWTQKKFKAYLTNLSFILLYRRKKWRKIGKFPNIETVESGAKDSGSWQWYMYICIGDIH